jgi:apolipoprotein D and lipocalin family protein
MRLALGILAIITLAAVSFVNVHQGEPMTVTSVDFMKYMGLWYSVAHIPTKFEAGCVQGTTAYYALLPNGQVEVTNTCYDANGKPSRVVGRAWIPDPSQPGKLKVSFVRVLGLSFFPGDYWILELPSDYSYAVVGDPGHAFGWILSRTPTLPDDVLAGIYNRLAASGYRKDQFVAIDQTMNVSKRLPPSGG